jgi:Fe-S oxidoreductase/FAD/FMN-containing dehydrogenase
VHGKTAQHVIELEVVLRGGIVHRARRTAYSAAPGFIGDIHRLVRDIATTRKSDIAATFPKLQRYMTGYNLAHMAGEDYIDLTRLICGSEGSLGVVTEARLKLTPVEKHRALVVLHYDTFDAALASARRLLDSDPGSIEAIDETVLSLARKDVIYDQVKAFIGGNAVNLVEYRGDDEARIRTQVDTLLGQLPSDVGHAVAWQDADIESLWTLRKKGVGLLGNAPGPRKPVPFVEDTVVPPERLYEYVREFRALLDGAGLRYGMFGHVDVGCLHVRPALDLKDPQDEALVRRITDQVTELVTRYGGLLWGEHGKGFRSELVPHHFGPVLYAEMQRIKALFDPRNQLNPGKIATAAGTDQPLIRIDGPTRGARDRQIAGDDQAELSTVIHCNGNGQCFDTNNDTIMCPSSKITRDRIHSPKGRATVMREWLRLLSAQGMSATAALQREGTLALRRRGDTRDFSHEVYDAMAGCLACKACATQCPVKVDVPEFRAQFLELYHRRYVRPLGDYLAANLERSLPSMARAPRLVNTLMDSAPGRWFTDLAGMVDVPHLDPATAEQRLRRHGIPVSDRLSSDPKTVVVVQDAFTAFYEPAVLEATCLLLRKLGYEPHVLPYFENGKALHIKGFLQRFGKLARQNARRLESVPFPMVGIEPAVVLTYRDEYARVLGKPLPVMLLQEWLVQQPLQRQAASGSFRLLSHCTEQALVSQAPRWWVQVFDKLGVPLKLVKAGCCGMCGIYGLETRHKADSLGIFDLSWRSKVDETTLATGFSCRHQVRRTMGFTPLHPAQALLSSLTL